MHSNDSNCGVFTDVVVVDLLM